MKNRDIVVRLRPYTSALTWAELNALTKQQVIDDISPPLSTEELEQLDIWGRHAFQFLKNEWIRDQHEGFIQTRYMPAFRSAINPSLSSYSVNEVYEYTLSEGLSEETALLVYKKAVKLYHGEVNNG